MTAGANSPSSAAPPRSPAAARKPRFALFVATAGGLGYIPFAPGTFGSLVGLVLVTAPWWLLVAATRILGGLDFSGVDPFLFGQCVLVAATAAFGVWSARRAAEYWQEKDPQRIVIDEVSGQHLTLLLGCAVPVWWRPEQISEASASLGLITWSAALNWKYLLLGLILFRVFDIWKPFPVRQAERLPGGWGIMADDWVAALYAALGLWIARAFGL